jgi:F1F0 ATPase subunit 2
MIPHDIVTLVIVFHVGLGIGAFYFGGLWWTVRRLPDSTSPAWLTFGSFSVRMGVTLLVFYLAMGGRWERLGVCFAGFLVARHFVMRRQHGQTRSPKELE